MSMVRTILAGTVDVSVVIRIVDSTDGTPETGVVFNTAGIDLEYRRELAASTDITEATLAALTTAHADGGFLHIGNGYYRLDLPDAACATGATGVMVHGTVTGMVVIGCYIELVAYDPYTAPPTVATIADGVWDEAQADHVAAGSFGVTASEIADILVDTAEIGAAGAGLTNINLPNQTMDITGNVTGNLSGSVGSVTGAVGSVTGAVGSVTGAVGSVTGAVGSVTANVNADVKKINGTTVNGDGGATPWGP